MHHENRSPISLAAWILSLILVTAPVVTADIVVGPWTFDDLAFADDATQLDVGVLYLFCGAVDLDDALVGYSPDRQIVNTGNTGGANHFQLDFLDMLAVNASGADIVFFESRFSADPYQFAVRPVGGVFTDFVDYAETEFLNTSETGCRDLYGLELELDDFGIASGVLVDAVQVRALTPKGRETPEGDPTMIAVLNSSPTPVRSTTWGWVKSTFR